MKPVNAKRASQKEDGFTLVEVALLLIIFSMIVAGMLNFINKMQTEDEFISNEEKLATIDRALHNYLIINDCYPFPATSTANDVDTGAFGSETIVATPPANNVVEGPLPARTLGLPDNYMLDSYGNRFTYAVTWGMADCSSTYSTQTPAIQLVDVADGVSTGTTDYIVLSHGRDGSGARTRSGNNYYNTDCSLAAAGTQGEDRENCDNDAFFLNTAAFMTDDDDDFVTFSGDTDQDRDFECVVIPPRYSGGTFNYTPSACPPGGYTEIIPTTGPLNGVAGPDTEVTADIYAYGIAAPSTITSPIGWENSTHRLCCRGDL